MRCRDPYDRSVEVPEQLFGDDRRDLGTPPAKTRVLFYGDEASGLRDFLENRLRIERHERADVYDGCRDAMLRLQGSIHKLLVEAFAEHSREKLLQVILLDPTVDSYRRAVAFMEEMLRLQADLLPTFE